MRVIDSSNLEIAFLLCLLPRNASINPDLSNLQEVIDDINQITCKRMSPENFLRNVTQLKQACDQLRKDNDIWTFGRSLLSGKHFANSNHLLTRYIMWQISITLGNEIDFRKYTNDPLSSTPNELIKLELPKAKTEFPLLPNSSVEIEGYNFLVYDNYLVLSNGGLIEYEIIAPSLQRHIAKGLHISQFSAPKDITSHYILNKNKPISTLDGIAFSDRISLICLDIDYLTELDVRTELQRFRTSHDLKMIRNKTRYEKLLGFANIIAERIIIESGAEILNGSKLFYITQGGIGSGKSSLMRYIESSTREDFVEISIDKCRNYCKLMDFFVKCHHHSDDYKALEYLARIIFELTLSKSLERGLNIIYDSTGIPYKERFLQFTQKLKDYGYKIGLLSASAPLSTERDRKDMDASIFSRIMKRLRKKKRAVPWDIVIQKHINHPKAFFEGISDPNLSEILIYDTMQKKGETKLLGKVYSVTDAEITEIEYAKSINKEYLSHQLTEILDIDLNKKDLQKIECLFFGNKLLVIFDTIKFIDFLQKAAFNTKATNYEELEFNTIPYHMPMLDYNTYDRGEKNNYIIRTQKL